MGHDRCTTRGRSGEDRRPGALVRFGRRSCAGSARQRARRARALSPCRSRVAIRCGSFFRCRPGSAAVSVERDAHEVEVPPLGSISKSAKTEPSSKGRHNLQGRVGMGPSDPDLHLREHLARACRSQARSAGTLDACLRWGDDEPGRCPSRSWPPSPSRHAPSPRRSRPARGTSRRARKPTLGPRGPLGLTSMPLQSVHLRARLSAKSRWR